MTRTDHDPAAGPSGRTGQRPGGSGAVTDPPAPEPPANPSRPALAHLLLFAAAYLAGFWVNMEVAPAPGFVAGLWPPGGLYLAVLLRSPARHWPWWMLAALFAELAGNALLSPIPVSALLVSFLGHSLEALTGAGLIRRYFGADFRLRGPREILALLVLGAALGPGIGALPGAAALAWAGILDYHTAWLVWFCCDAASVLVFAPPVLAGDELPRAWRTAGATGRAEFAALLGCLGGVIYLVFLHQWPMAYAVMLPLVWAALRFEVSGVILPLCLLALAAAQQTAAGRGIFASPGLAPEERLWLLQLFLGITALTALLIAALTRRHRAALAEVRRGRDELEARVAERTAQLAENEARFRLLVEENVVGILVHDARQRYVEANPAACRMLGYRREEILARGVADLVVAAEQPRITPEEARFLGGDATPASFRIRRKDGSTFIGEVTGGPLPGGRFLGMLRDISERHRTDETLRQLREEQQLILDATPAMIWFKDTGNRILRVNAAAARALDLAKEAIEGRDTAELFPEDAGGYHADDLAVAESGEPRLGIEEPFRRPGGETGWVRTDKIPLKDAAGRVTRILVMSVDITGQRRALAALRESEERFRLATEAMAGIVFEWSPGADAVFRSSGLINLLGFRPDEVPATIDWWTSRAHPGDLAEVRAIFTAAMAARQPHCGCEYRVRHRNGRYVWVWDNCRLVYDAAGAATRVVGCTVSIDRHKRAEAALRESEARYRTIFGLSLSGVLVVCPETGAILDCNDQAARVLGYDRAEFIRLRIADLEARESPADVVARIARIQANGDDVFETQLWAKSGERRDMLVKARPVTLAGQPVLLAVLEDLTERKRTEAALREADRRKDEFLATLAHELRNPLAPIHAASRVLRKSGGAGLAGGEMLAILERQADHLTRLVDDLLEVSRISRGKIELRREPVGLGAVVAHALEISAPLIEAGRHRLSVSLPEEPLTLDADPVRLAQVLANLLNNAAKYTEPGGRIELRAERRDGEVVIAIHDTGIGISAEMLPRVFDLFAQVDQSLGRAQGGLGIGLALARRLVELHGGGIEARSEGLGRGSEFAVRLPLAAAPAATPPPVEPAPPAPAPRRVLVVDDNRDAADSLALLLDEPGAEVRAVYDGAAALALLAGFRPEVVLLDLGMPGLDGYETARRIRRSPEGRDLVLIALTGWGQEDDRRRTEAAGFDRHLVKPVDFDRLRALLGELAGAGGGIARASNSKMNP